MKVLRSLGHVLLVMAFCFLVFPIALVARMAGRDALRLKPHPQLNSYWIKRAKANRGLESFRKQD